MRTEGLKLSSDTFSSRKVSAITSDVSAFCDAENFQLYFGQFLFKHLHRCKRLNLQFIQSRNFGARHLSDIFVRAAGSLDQIIEVRVYKPLCAIPHRFTPKSI